MRLEQFEYILEVAKTKSISLAAENLYISQPALSRAIKSLEKEFGVSLLLRTTTGVFLTEVGEQLLPKMQHILYETNDLLEKANIIKNTYEKISIPSSLTIQTIPTIADSLLPPTLEQFSTFFPDVNVQIQMMNLSDPFTLSNLSQFDLTIAMNVNNTLDQSISVSQYQTEVLFTENPTIVVACTHALSKKNTVSLEEVLQNKLILHDNGFSANDFYCHLTTGHSDKKLNVILKSNNPRAISQVLINQNAILLTNNFLCENDYKQNENFKILPVKNAKCTYFCLYATDHPYIHFLKKFIDIIKSIRAQL